MASVYVEDSGNDLIGGSVDRMGPCWAETPVWGHYQDQMTVHDPDVSLKLSLKLDDDRIMRCVLCDTFIRIGGHHLRCTALEKGGEPFRLSGRPQTAWNSAQTDAWLLDSFHKMDVKVGLLLAGMCGPELDRTLQALSSNAAMKKWWFRIRDTSSLISPTGSSDHNVGTAFEANYLKLRLTYLEDVFGVRIARVVRGYIRFGGIDKRYSLS